MVKKTRPERGPRGTLARYPIRAVSKLTGISIDTLRAWERRHGVVSPIRDDRGRLYTDADVNRLRLLQRALADGHSIGRLAPLTNLVREPALIVARLLPASSGAPEIAHRLMWWRFCAAFRPFMPTISMSGSL